MNQVNHGTLVGPVVAALLTEAFQKALESEPQLDMGDYHIESVKAVGEHIVVRIEGPGSEFDDESRTYWVKLSPVNIRELPV